MLEGHISRCVQRIAEEEALARKAATPEGALAHSQAAMILKSELSVLKHRLVSNGSRTASFGQMLADIW